MPRIIDFGLAKAIGPQIGDETMMTRAGDWVGTPGYMSPEQVDSSADVDTRTNVYALGVVLYVLLTGDQPFDISQWRKEPFYEVLRQLREVDPLRPSSKLRKQDAATLAQLSEKRQNEPGMLIRQITGDLDCIVLKALEKDPNRRYATPLGPPMSIATCGMCLFPRIQSASDIARANMPAAIVWASPLRSSDCCFCLALPWRRRLSSAKSGSNETALTASRSL
jgi:serine/threonine protein kinase